MEIRLLKPSDAESYLRIRLEAFKIVLKHSLQAIKRKKTNQPKNIKADFNLKSHLLLVLLKKGNLLEL